MKRRPRLQQPFYGCKQRRAMVLDAFPRCPFPTHALFRFHELSSQYQHRPSNSKRAGKYLGLLLSVNNTTHQNHHKMLPLLHVDIVNGREEPHVADREARFFLYFTRRAAFEGFAPFEVSTGESQGAFYVLISPENLEKG